MTKRAIVIIAGMGLLASACARGASSDVGRIVPIDGAVEVLDGETWEPVGEPQDVSLGTKVRSGSNGWARIELPRGRLELAPGAEVHLITPNVPQVVAGSVLATTGPQMRLDVGGVPVIGYDAVVRIDRAYSLQVAVYQGTAHLPQSGLGVPLSSFQEIALANRAPSRGAEPLKVDVNDPWDLRLLGEAIDIGTSLDQQQSGLTPKLDGRDGRRVVLDILGDDIPASELNRLLETYQMAEVVVASLLATSLGSMDPLTLVDDILDLRQLGAQWIVIAGKFGVARTVLGAMSSVIGEMVDEIRNRAEERAERIEARRQAARQAAAGAPGSSSTDSGSSGRDRDTDPGPGPCTQDCNGGEPECAGDAVTCAVEDVLGGGTGVSLP